MGVRPWGDIREAEIRNKNNSSFLPAAEMKA